MGQDSDTSDLTMPGRKRATVLLAFGGYVNTAIVLLQGLLMVPLYLEFLGARTYGLWLASGGILGMLWMMNFGISSMLIQRIARAYGEKDLAQVRAYFVNGLFVYLFICLLYGLAGLLVSIWIPDVLSIDGDEAKTLRQCFLIAVLAMALAIINECLRSLGQAMLRPSIPLVGMAIGRIIGIAVTIWMLLDGLGLWAIPLGLLLMEGLILVVNTLHVLYLFQIFRMTAGALGLDIDLIKEYVKTSPLLLLAKSGDSLSRESEPLLITMYVNAEATTAYMIARKAADMVFLVISVLNGAILGSFSHLVGEADSEKIKQMVFRLSFLAFAVSLVGYSAYVAANNAFLSLWVGMEYLYDSGLIFFIGVGFFSRALRGMFWQILYAIGDFTVTSLVVFCEAVIKIGLVLLLLGWIGVAAIPYALAASSFFALLALAGRLNRLLSVTLRRESFLRTILSILGCVTLTSFFAIGTTWLSFIATSAILVILLSLLITVINWQNVRVFLAENRNVISR